MPPYCEKHQCFHELPEGETSWMRSACPKCAATPSAQPGPEPSNVKTMSLNRECQKCGWVHVLGTECPKSDAMYGGAAQPGPSKVRCSICHRVDNLHKSDGTAEDGSHIFISEWDVSQNAAAQPGETTQGAEEFHRKHWHQGEIKGNVYVFAEAQPPVVEQDIKRAII